MLIDHQPIMDIGSAKAWHYQLTQDKPTNQLPFFFFFFDNYQLIAN